MSDAPDPSTDSVSSPPASKSRPNFRATVLALASGQTLSGFLRALNRSPLKPTDAAFEPGRGMKPEIFERRRLEQIKRHRSQGRALRVLPWLLLSVALAIAIASAILALNY